MQNELATGGADVAFAAINSSGDENFQANLTAQCSFPLFQDVAAVGAWQLHGGGKDDFFVYRADGTLSAFLPISGAINVNLATADGYQNLLDAITEASN